MFCWMSKEKTSCVRESITNWFIKVKGICMGDTWSLVDKKKKSKMLLVGFEVGKK